MNKKTRELRVWERKLNVRLSAKQRCLLTHKTLEKLDGCKDDSARRLLLGVSEKEEMKK